jgi:drug/metabolite transporter (DMT)-like permease
LRVLTTAKRTTAKLSRNEALLLVLAALLGITLNQLALVYGLHFTTATTIALLFGTTPIVVSLVSHFSGKEQLGFWSWLGAGLSFVGVAL